MMMIQITESSIIQFQLRTNWIRGETKHRHCSFDSIWNWKLWKFKDSNSRGSLLSISTVERSERDWSDMCHPPRQWMTLSAHWVPCVCVCSVCVVFEPPPTTSLSLFYTRTAFFFSTYTPPLLVVVEEPFAAGRNETIRSFHETTLLGGAYCTALHCPAPPHHHHHRGSTVGRMADGWREEKMTKAKRSKGGGEEEDPRVGRTMDNEQVIKWIKERKRKKKKPRTDSDGPGG